MLASYRGVFGSIVLSAVVLTLVSFAGGVTDARANSIETLCVDTTALNFEDFLPCVYPEVVLCEDDSASNFGEEGECVYEVASYGRIKVWKHVVDASEVDYSQFSFTVNGGDPITFPADEIFTTHAS